MSRPKVGERERGEKEKKSKRVVRNNTKTFLPPIIKNESRGGEKKGREGGVSSFPLSLSTGRKKSARPTSSGKGGQKKKRKEKKTTLCLPSPRTKKQRREVKERHLSSPLRFNPGKKKKRKRGKSPPHHGDGKNDISIPSAERQEGGEKGES